MTPYQRQRGSLMIVTVVMILVLGFLGVAITFLSVTSTHNAVDELAATEAFVLAESGLERGIKQWSLASSTYAGEGPVSFGKGSFTVATPVIISATEATISSSATVPTMAGDVIRTVEATVQLGGPLFNAPMTDTTWPTDESAPSPDDQGSSNIAGGRLKAITEGGNSDSSYVGWRETSITPPSITLNAGETINLDLEYRKKCNNALTMYMAVEMVDTAGNAVTPPVWYEDTIFNNNSWLTAPTSSATVPAGTTVDRIRLFFNLKKDGNGCRPEVSFRNIVISSTGGSGTNIVSWQEIIP